MMVEGGRGGEGRKVGEGETGGRRERRREGKGRKERERGGRKREGTKEKRKEEERGGRKQGEGERRGRRRGRKKSTAHHSMKIHTFLFFLSSSSLASNEKKNHFTILAHELIHTFIHWSGRYGHQLK